MSTRNVILGSYFTSGIHKWHTQAAYTISHCPIHGRFDKKFTKADLSSVTFFDLPPHESCLSDEKHMSCWSSKVTAHLTISNNIC